MSDRVKALTVILKEDMRQDDVDKLCNAIYLFNGVLGIETQEVTVEDYVERARIKSELIKKLFEALKDDMFPLQKMDKK